MFNMVYRLQVGKRYTFFLAIASPNYPMMKFLNAAFFRSFCFLALAVLAATSCTDPITVGSDLLADDRVTVDFTDQLPIKISTVDGDSVKIFDASSGVRVQRHLFGTIEDGVFGKVTRDVGVTLRLGITNTGLAATPLFSTNDSFQLDSLVMILPYDTAASYGEILGTSMDYEVFELDGPYDESQDFNSNETMLQLPNQITSGSFSISDEIRLIHDTTTINDSFQLHHVRIKLPMEIVDRVAMADSNSYVSDSTFLENVLSGFVIRSTSSDNGFLSLNFGNTEARMNAYFSKIDGSLISFYPFDLDLGLATYDFDRSGSLTEQLQAEENDNISLVEGGGGLFTRIEIENVESLSDKIINQAELQFYLEESNGVDYDAFPAAPLVTLYYRDADGFTEVIEDVDVIDRSNANQANRQFFLGGDLETNEDNGLFFYTTNLSAHLQGIVDGDYEPVVFIRVVPDNITPNRFILRGPGNSDTPMTLKVAFTEF